MPTLGTPGHSFADTVWFGILLGVFCGLCFFGVSVYYIRRANWSVRGEKRKAWAGLLLSLAGFGYFLLREGWGYNAQMGLAAVVLMATVLIAFRLFQKRF